MILSDRTTQECMDMIEDHIGIRLTVEQFNAFILRNKFLIEGINSFGPSDTMERENIMNAFAKDLTGREWPTYGDTAEYSEQFHKEFNVAISSIGYKKVNK